MPDIKDSVGDGGVNNDHDVALVQAMLVLVKNAKNQPYLTYYDGIYGKLTKAAIITFQNEKLPKKAADPAQQAVKPPLLPPDPAKQAVKPPLKAPPAGGATGLIKSNDDTIKALNANLPAGFKELHALTGGRTVYLAGTKADMLASKKVVTTDALLEAGFRGKVGTLIDEMYQDHKIVLKIAGRDGRRRTYQQQYALTLKATASGGWVTNAGPGESNHNYGRAVDIGFEGLTWLKGNGQKETRETAWLHKLEKKSAPQALLFWDAMRKLATKGTAKLHRGPVHDRPHIQAWDDATVSMTKRLVVHLNAVGKVKWERGNQGARFRNYKADLGLGGAKYHVGNGQEIWGGKSPVTKADYAAAKTAAAKAAAAKNPPAAANKKAPAILPSNITQKDIDALRKAPKADFEAGDTHWKKWTPN